MATFDEIRKANEAIMTTTLSRKDKNGVVHEKEYAEVNQRIKAFRIVHPNGSIETNMYSFERDSKGLGIVTMQTIIKDEEGKVIGTGYAQEKENSSFINGTSYIENCETSAVGRALGMCGFGIDTSVASYEEVVNAIENQKKNEKVEETPKNKKVEDFPKGEKTQPIDYRALLYKKLAELKIDVKEFAKQHNLNGKSTQEDFKWALDLLAKQEKELGFNE